jgi:hypothetical protein
VRRGIRVPSAVRDQVHGRIDIASADVEDRLVSNRSRPTWVCAVVLDPAAVSGHTAASTVEAPPEAAHGPPLAAPTVSRCHDAVSRAVRRPLERATAERGHAQPGRDGCPTHDRYSVATPRAVRIIAAIRGDFP